MRCACAQSYQGRKEWAKMTLIYRRMSSSVLLAVGIIAIGVTSMSAFGTRYYVDAGTELGMSTFNGKTGVETR